MPSASDDIRAAIDAAGGALRFDRFLELALYGPNGFYTTVGRAGRRGDFITSPEVGPLFGAVLARWIEAEFWRCGRPDDFTVVECGAGPGTLARAVLAAAPHWRGRYIAVELSAQQRALHPDGARSVPDLPEQPFVGVVIANELLDNVPFRLAVYDGGWREVAIAAEGGRFVELLSPLDEDRWFLPRSAPHGARLPLQDGARRWLDATLGGLRQGTVIAFDYVVERTAELIGRPWRSWLRTYRGHERGSHYLFEPGSQDITVHVCADQLGQPAIESQAAFLQRWGIDELVAEGRRAWADAATRPDVAALRMRSRVREAEALLDAAGLGGFGVLTWGASAGGD